MRFLFILCVVLFSAPAFSQNVVRAKVVDPDGVGIPYAAIVVDGHIQIGTYANDKGDFELRIPDFVTGGKLIVSSLGYNKKIILLSEVSAATIRLEKNSIMLREVVVTPISELQRLGMAALKAMSKNYPNKVHYQTAFYRKISTDSLRYTGFVESILYIKDPGYQRSSNEIRIEALQARAGVDLIPLDTTVMKTVNRMGEGFGAPSLGSLQRVYEYNTARLYKEPHTYFNVKGNLFSDSKGPATKTFELEDITVENRDTIVHLLMRTLMVGGMQVEEAHLAINKKDKAIVEYSRGLFTNYRVEIKFRKHSNGRYYLRSISSVTPIFYPKERNKAFYKIEMLEIDDIEFKSSKNRKKGIVLSKAVDYNAKKVPYDPAFWKGYKNQRPINPDILKSLEEDRPLEEQFKDPE